MAVHKVMSKSDDCTSSMQVPKLGDENEWPQLPKNPATKHKQTEMPSRVNDSSKSECLTQITDAERNHAECCSVSAAHSTVNSCANATEHEPEQQDCYHKLTNVMSNSSLLANFVQTERRARDAEDFLRVMTVLHCNETPSALPAKFARETASAAAAAIAANYSDLCFWLVKDHVVILATHLENEALRLIDLTASILHGCLIDEEDRIVEECNVVQNFSYSITAMTYNSTGREEHVLQTQGGEHLEISCLHTAYLLDGWFAARLSESDEFKWFPVRCCNLTTHQNK